LPAGNPDQLAPVLKFPADLDRTLKAMCTKAMAAMPDGRYSSMREWVAELSAYRQAMNRQSDGDVRLPLGGSSLSRLSGSKLGRDKLPPATSPGTSGLMVPNSQTSSPTFSQMQELRQMSDSAIPGMPPMTRPRYARPNFLPWLVTAIMGGVALSVTLFLLTGGFNKDSQQNQQEQKPELPAGVPPEKLKADLEDPNAEVRKVAAEKILEQREVGLVDDLVNRLGDPNWSADSAGADKRKMLRALEDLAPDRVPMALQRAAATDNVHVRIWAVRTIAQTGDRRLVSALASRVTDDPHPRVRIVAAEALRDLHWNDEEAINALVKSVSAEPWRGKPKDDGDDESDPKASGRDASLEALVQLDRKKTEETLTRLRHSGNATLQQWANREFALRFAK
ncbi:MAG: HEAT repeat domain-containing protein, partial [Gemmataceae bacterium]